MESKEKNIRLLEEYRSLEEDWNGYGAPSLTPELVDKCIAIIKGLNMQPEVFPTGRNSIHFEYDVESFGYLEFELFLDRIEFYAELQDETIDKTYTYEEIEWNQFLQNHLSLPLRN